MECKLCGYGDAQATTGVCQKCGQKLGVREMAQSRRPKVPCTRCNATRFIRCVPREYSVETDREKTVASVGPMTLTQVPQTSAHLFGDTTEPDVAAGGLGILETYVCMKCGFVEWYCQDPERVKIGPEFMTEIVECEAQSPYRG